MEPQELRVPVPTPSDQQKWSLAATVFVPGDGVDRAPVLVLFPGGGYNRRYFDLPVPGFSQARHHTARGTVVIAMDYLGAGDSSVPPFEVSDLATVAAANDAAVQRVLDELAVEPTVLVGAGQSLGGHALVGTQALHRTFDAIALLGSSMAGTVIPSRPGLEGRDFEFAFHWQDARVSSEAAGLIAADLAGGVPARQVPPLWGTANYPGFSAMGMTAGAYAPYAAAVDVPVLLVTGERDVCRSEAEERGLFTRAPEVIAVTVPRTAHMHNFSDNRAIVWQHVDDLLSRAGGVRPVAGRSRST